MSEGAGREGHWQGVYRRKADTEVSWYQASPTVSLELIAEHGPGTGASVIDIGGGTSLLAVRLLDAGYRDVTVLDISEAAIARAESRIGKRPGAHFMVADASALMPVRTWDVWHDRAAFHFLMTAAEQAGYIAALERGTQPGSIAIFATFALDGPEKCSGLPVQRYSPETLAARLGRGFALIHSASEAHHTLSGAVQRFTWAVFRRG
jgi:SAM-dependent methyltransferase